MLHATLDPTREELISYLEGIYSAVTCGEVCHKEDEHDDDKHDGCACRFDIEEAAYYVAAHWHGGKTSDLYAALCASPFTPGMCASDLPDDEERPIASDLYREASAWIAGK